MIMNNRARLLVLDTCLFLFYTVNAFTIPKPAVPRTGSSSPLPAGSLAASNTAVSRNEELLPGIAAIEQGNAELFAQLEAIREVPYFRLYSVDILASCEYMPQQLFECYTESCEIYPEDEDEVPSIIQTKDLEEHDFELDGWFRWDMPSEDYYDTLAFPEGYTGYDGAEVWNFIHKRICFSEYKDNDDHWKAGFNKAVSGLHSIISAQVVRGIRNKIDDGEEFADNEVWRDPVAEYQRRLGTNGETPLAVENLYFCFMLLLSAVSMAKGRLLQECETGMMDQTNVADLKGMLDSPLLSDESIGVASRKLRDHAVQSSEGLWEARMRSRDLLRIMNCVQCNKCRLHGKISVLGLTTAMQILLGKAGEGDDPQKIHRVQLAALVTTLHKCSTAIQFCQEMQ